jgi:hypothetical protein
LALSKSNQIFVLFGGFIVLVSGAALIAALIIALTG